MEGTLDHPSNPPLSEDIAWFPGMHKDEASGQTTAMFSFWTRDGAVIGWARAVRTRLSPEEQYDPRLPFDFEIERYDRFGDEGEALSRFDSLRVSADGTATATQAEKDDPPVGLVAEMVRVMAENADYPAGV